MIISEYSNIQDDNNDFLGGAYRLSLTKIMKALSDETRVSILNLLRMENLCVCEIEGILENSQSNISRHLAKLREAELIVSDKKSQWVYCRLNQKTIDKYNFLKALIEEDFAKQPQYQTEIDKLKRYREQNGICQAPE